MTTPITMNPRAFLLPTLGLALALTACGGDAPEPDAYGNFEATETTVSAQTSGRLLAFTAREGDRLAEGAVVGLVDTTQLTLQREALVAQRTSLLAQRQATLAQTAEVEAQAGALRAQLATADEELARTQRLFDADAATARELNQRQGEVAALREQVAQALARGGTIREQAASLAAQAAHFDAQAAALAEQLRDARIVNPTPGTVLTALARRGEVIAPGTPLYTVADLDTLTLRAYATGGQLARLRLGMPVEVRHDDGAGGLAQRRGTVVRIASEAEFTPNPIQTRDERAELVYAFEVRVPNLDGALKVGMPGEIRFPNDPNGEPLAEAGGDR